MPRAAAPVALLVALLGASGCAPAVSGLTLEAVRIEARVKTALVNDPIVGVRVIHVRMVGSVAQLSGHVESEAEATRAAEIARAVSGVSEVQSRLQIGVSPADVEADLELRADPMRGPAYELAELEDRPHLLAIGGAMGWANQAGPAAGTRVSLQPLVKLGSDEGFGPAIAFEWFDARVAASPDAPIDAGAVRLRPMMGGVRYARQFGRVSVVPSLVAGYSFNRIGVPEEGAAARLPVEVGNSFVWRPGVSVWIDTSRRTVLNLSIGRAFTDPRVTFVDGGRLSERRRQRGHDGGARRLRLPALLRHVVVDTFIDFLVGVDTRHPLRRSRRRRGRAPTLRVRRSPAPSLRTGRALGAAHRHGRVSPSASCCRCTRGRRSPASAPRR